MKADRERAKEFFIEEKYTCVVCRGDEIFTSRERGVKPLVEWLEQKKKFTGFCVADKVVGKAAALLYVLLGVEDVYAPVMSEGAMEIFRKNGITFSNDVTVLSIQNRSNTGICPMEETVKEVDNPVEALQKIKDKLRELEQCG